jgi:hypothetical protein
VNVISNVLQGYTTSHSSIEWCHIYSHESPNLACSVMDVHSSLLHVLGTDVSHLYKLLQFCVNASTPLGLTIWQQWSWALSIGMWHHTVWSLTLIIATRMSNVTGTVICFMCTVQAKNMYELPIALLWSI